MTTLAAMHPPPRTAVKPLPIVHDCSTHVFPGPTPSLFRRPNPKKTVTSFLQKNVLNGEGEGRNVSLMETLGVKPSALKDVDICKVGVYGHRGSIYEHVENTLDGFSRNFDISSNGFELDVFRLKCNTLVCYHGDGGDERPGDMTNTHDSPRSQIENFTYEELLRLPLNSNCEEFVIANKEGIKDYVVPTLRSALMLAKAKSLKVKVELKGENCEDFCVALIKELDIENLISFSSFNHSRIKRIRELHPTIPTGALFSANVPSNYVEICSAVGATEVHLRFDTCTSERVIANRNSGLKTMAWFRGPITMNDMCGNGEYADCGNEDIDMYWIVLGSGCDEICCNRPGVVVGMRDLQRARENNGKLSQTAY